MVTERKIRMMLKKYPKGGRSGLKVYKEMSWDVIRDMFPYIEDAYDGLQSLK